MVVLLTVFDDLGLDVPADRLLNTWSEILVTLAFIVFSLGLPPYNLN